MYKLCKTNVGHQLVVPYEGSIKLFWCLFSQGVEARTLCFLADFQILLWKTVKRKEHVAVIHAMHKNRV